MTASYLYYIYIYSIVFTVPENLKAGLFRSGSPVLDGGALRTSLSLDRDKLMTAESVTHQDKAAGHPGWLAIGVAHAALCGDRKLGQHRGRPFRHVASTVSLARACPHIQAPCMGVWMGSPGPQDPAGWASEAGQGRGAMGPQACVVVSRKWSSALESLPRPAGPCWARTCQLSVTVPVRQPSPRPSVLGCSRSSGSEG